MGNNVGPVAKEAGEQWAVLKKKDKDTYETKASTNNASYKKELASFQAAGGTIPAKKSSKTVVKDPDAPKRPGSAYMLWLNENRPSIVKALPESAKVTEVMT